MTKLSIVIPTYNEEKRIEASLSKMKAYLETNDYDYEIVVSDDGSTDTTPQVIKNLQKDWKNLILQKNPHRGKGSALISGVKVVSKDYVYLADADLSVSIEEMPKFLVWITENSYDIAIATREGTGAMRVNEPYMRHFMGRIFNLIVQLVILPGINDTQCGFKLFKTKVAKDVFNHTLLYTAKDPVIKKGRLGAFDVEFIYVAKKMGYKIKEVPVTWVYGEESKAHKLRDSYYNTVDVLRVRINSWKGLYPSKRSSK